MATPDVRVRLSAEGTAEVVSALKKVASESESAGRKAKKAGDDGAQSFRKFNTDVKALAASIGVALSAKAILGYVDGIIKASEELQNMGLISSSTRESVRQLGDEMDAFGRQAQVVASRFLAGLAPAVTDTLQDAQMEMDRTGDAAERMGSRLGKVWRYFTTRYYDPSKFLPRPGGMDPMEQVYGRTVPIPDVVIPEGTTRTTPGGKQFVTSYGTPERYYPPAGGPAGPHFASTGDRTRTAEPFIDELQIQRVHDAAMAAEDLQNNVRLTLQYDLADWFAQGASGAASFSEAMRGLASSVIASLSSIASQSLAQSVFNFLGSHVGSLNWMYGGGAGGVGDFPVTAAAGGLITGPGTGTSDSIHARLSNMEYVMPARVVMRPGMLQHLEGIRTNFASGGLVSSSPGGHSTMHIGLDDGLVLRALDSAEGQKIVVKAVAKNRRAVGRMIG